MTFKTVKEYYLNQWLGVGATNWKRISEKVVAIERSIAFPEGGGQLGDRGFIEQNGVKVAFTTTQKNVGIGRVVILPNFPVLNVGGELHIHLSEKIPKNFCENKPIRIEIDTEYRAKLTRSHTAAHLVIMALKRWFSNIEGSIQGCSIEADGGRFDLAIEWPNAEFIRDVQLEFNRLVDANLPIVMTEFGGEAECRVWNCDGVAIPCGGTHLEKTGQTGKFSLRKKNKGKGRIRVYFEVASPLFDEILNQFKNKKEERKGMVAIVDAYGVGIHLPNAFKDKGLLCVHIHSRPYIPKVFKSTFRPDFFEEEIFFDGDIDNLCGRLKKMGVIAVLPGVEPGVELAGILSERLNLRTNGSALGAARRDKYLMQRALKDNGLASIRQHKTLSIEDAISFAESAGWPIVVKPLRSAGTDGVVLCWTKADIESAFKTQIGNLNKFETRNDELLCQEFIRGAEYVVDTVSRDGQHLVVGIWKYIKRHEDDLDFVRSHMDILHSTGSPSNELCAYTVNVLNTLGVQNGAAHSEIKLTEKGPVLIETAARTQGSMGSLLANRCVGFSQIEMIADVYTDGSKFFQAIGNNYIMSKHCAIVFLNSMEEGPISALLSDRVISSLPSYVSHSLRFSVGDYLPKTIDVFTRGGWIALMHERKETIEADLQQIREWERQGLLYVVKNLSHSRESFPNAMKKKASNPGINSPLNLEFENAKLGSGVNGLLPKTISAPSCHCEKRKRRSNLRKLLISGDCHAHIVRSR